MPGHTPEEKAKNAAARSIQPGPDLQGGSAAVPNDPGSNDSGIQARIDEWRKFLRKPEVQAGLLQFSAQMLQTNPGGFLPAFGTSLAAGLGAAGRFSKLERERGIAQGERASATRQQQIENQFEGRRVTEIEKRTEILGRPKAGKKQVDERKKVWGDFVDSEAEFSGGILDPTTRDSRVNAAIQAEKEQVMQAALSQGVTPSQVIDDYLGGNREKLRAALGFPVGEETVDGTADPEDAGGDELTPGVPEFKTKGGRGGLVSRESQIQAEISKVEAELVTLREKGPATGGRGGKRGALRVFDRAVSELETRIADLRSRLEK